ncbi:leucine zipper transcription factor-like protein 1, partial [Silurus asotus]
QADFGFSEHHQNEVINYMRFARSKRLLRLKTIDSCFQELKDSRLVEETFTVDEVSEMLDGLQVVVRGEVEMELINTAHTNVLLLRQLFSQAEKFYLKLQTDISELESRELLEQVAAFEKTDFKSGSKINQESYKPKLAPLNEGGVSELLNKEIARLQEENDKLKARVRILENIIMYADDMVIFTYGENELEVADKLSKGMQKVVEWLQTSCLTLNFDKTVSMFFSNKSKLHLTQNIQVNGQNIKNVKETKYLGLTIDSNLDKKFQQTAAYRNMKEILSKKNDQIKDLRKRLQR